MKASRLVPVLIVGAIFIAIGVFVGRTANWFPVQASAESGQVDALFNTMLGIATVIFLIVECGIIASIIFFRHKPGDNSDGPAIHGNNTLEIVWTAIPSVIVLGLAFMSFKVFSDMQTPQPNEMLIKVTGQQFIWSFSYPYENDPKLTADQNTVASNNMISNELHLPVNQAIQVEIQSKDVIHAFFIPEFRIKQDAIPGHVTVARFTPTIEGQYHVVCTELCGQGHANMHSDIYVESQQDYDTWLAKLQADAVQAALDPRRADRGKQLITSGKYPCGACHTLTDIGTTGNVGPVLNGVATRALNNVDNRLTNRSIDVNAPDRVAQYLRAAITNPSGYVIPGYANLMPKNFGDPTVMPDDDREAIINYLLTEQ